MAEDDSQPTDPGDPMVGQIATADPPDADVATPADADADTQTDPPEAEAVDQDDFLGELARAMHTAAESQYERLNAELERRRSEQVDAIAARASTEVDELKAGSEADISAIDAWAKGETEKIKLERLRRIDTRREQLANELQRHDTIRERGVFAVEVAVDAHRAELEEFFSRMEHESDPARIATVASTLPPFPVLAEVAEHGRRGAAAEFALLDQAAEPEVSSSRLMAVMDPGAGTDTAEVARPWESEPHAVGVAVQGLGASGPEPSARTQATLLRSIPSKRPMAGQDDPGSVEDEARR